jgi:hypothetical protein
MLLENLARLNDAKTNIRLKSMTEISSHAASLDHTVIIEVWMVEILRLATQIKPKTDDDLTVQYLGVRLFNSTACALDLVFSGFYQAATAHIRDVMEINFLLADFIHDKTHITRWRESNQKDRKKFFKPVHVRMRIDKTDGFSVQKRKKAYELLSNYGVHPTPEGNAMLARNGLIVAGPFYDFSRLKVLLEELAKRLSTGTLSFTEFFTSYDEIMDGYVALLAKTTEWRDKYLVVPPSATPPAQKSSTNER